MLGPPKPRRLDEPIAVSLEDLVPYDHFYRHLEAKLDLSFVRDWTGICMPTAVAPRSTRGLLQAAVGDVLRRHPLGAPTDPGGQPDLALAGTSATLGIPARRASASARSRASPIRSLNVFSTTSWRGVKRSPYDCNPYIGGENQRGFFGMACSGLQLGSADAAITLMFADWWQVNSTPLSLGNQRSQLGTHVAGHADPLYMRVRGNLPTDQTSKFCATTNFGRRRWRPAPLSNLEMNLLRVQFNNGFKPRLFLLLGREKHGGD